MQTSTQTGKGVSQGTQQETPLVMRNIGAYTYAYDAGGRLVIVADKDNILE